MADGCRDCTTCTKSWLGRVVQKLAVGLLYLCTIGVAFLVKRGVMRHCPQCSHLLSGHARRRDGSFHD